MEAYHLGSRFVQVSCGDKHSVAVTAEGQVFSFGCGEHGQLGLGDQVDKLRPTHIASLDKVFIKTAVCGAIHTVLITDQGELYLFGFGEHFYPNDEQNFFYSPVKIPFKEKTLQVACGQSHIIALTVGGDVYTWGSGAFGQLGQGVKGNLNTPRLVLTGKNIRQVAAGTLNSSSFSSQRYHRCVYACFEIIL